MKKLTPILVVEAIEPSLSFWVDALGFARTVEVPHEDALGFVILEKDGYEVMLQSTASMKADVPATMPPPGRSVLYVEIEDLTAIEEWLAEYEILVPRRKTFYGAEEVFVREPGGNVVGFAEFGQDGES